MPRAGSWQGRGVQPEPSWFGAREARAECSRFPQDTKLHNPPAAGHHRWGSAGGLSEAQSKAQHKPALGKGTGPLGASLPPTGVHHNSVPAIRDTLPHRAERHLLSGTRTSQGNGMVGLLSLMSITTTVSVAEPTRGGVPLSIAVTTKLQESTKAQQEGHNHTSGAVCTQHLEQEDTAHVHRLEHVVKPCTSGVCGEWMCTEHLEWVNGCAPIKSIGCTSGCVFGGQWVFVPHLEHMSRPCTWAQVSGAPGRQWINAQTWHVGIHSWGGQWMLLVCEMGRRLGCVWEKSWAEQVG